MPHTPASASASAVTTSPTAAAVAARRRPLRVVVLGDSVAETLAAGLPDIPGRRGVTIINDATIGCGVTTLSRYRYFGAVHTRLRRCLGWTRHWAAAVTRAHADLALVVVGRWELMDQQLRGRWTHIGEAAYDAYLTAALREGYRAAATTGKPVVFATAPYFHRGDRPDGGTWPEDDPRRVDTYNSLLRAALAGEPHAAIIDLNQRTSGGRHHYTNVVDHVRLRYDGVHFNPQAGRWLAAWLYRRLLSAADALNP